MAFGYLRFLNGIELIPQNTVAPTIAGEIRYNSSLNAFEIYTTQLEVIVTNLNNVTISNKTFVNAILNNPTADTITGIAGGPLTLNAATNQNIAINSNGTGNILLDSIIVKTSSISGATDITGVNNITGGASTLTIQSASNQNLILQAQGTGSTTIQGINILNNVIAGAAGSALTVESATNQNLALTAQGTGHTLIDNFDIKSGVINSSSLVDIQRGGASVFQVDTALARVIDNGVLQLREAAANGTNFLGLQAAANMAADYTITFPAAAPTTDTALVWNGTNYAWGTVSGGFTTSTQNSLSASGTITISLTQAQQSIVVAGASGPVTLSGTPFGSSNPVDGAVFILIGSSDTNTVTINNNNATRGCVMNGSVTLGKYDAIYFEYRSSLNRYVEIARQ